MISASPPPSRFLRHLPIALILFGLAFRLAFIHRHGIWLDEALGIRGAQGSWREFARFMTLDVHPPLYYLILRVLVRISDQPVVWRIFSALCGTAGLIVFYRTIREHLHAGAALFSLFLLTISPFAVFYSQEIRMYGLLFLLSCLCMNTVMRMAKRPEAGPFSVFMIFAGAALYTHYYAGILVAGLLVFYAWDRINDGAGKRRTAAEVLYCGIGLAILFFPWLGMFQRHLATGAMGGVHAQSHLSDIGHLAMDCVMSFAGGQVPWAPWERIHLFTARPWQMGSFGWLVFFTLLLFAFVRGIRTLRSSAPLFRLCISALGTGFILTLAHLALRGRFYPRTLIIYLPFVMPVLGAGLSGIRQTTARYAATGFLGLCFTVSAFFNVSVNIREVSPHLARILKESARPGDVIYHTSPMSYLPMKIYLPDAAQRIAGTGGLPILERTLAGGDVIEDLRDCPDAERIWLVVAYWGPGSRWDRDKTWPRLLGESGRRVVLIGRLSIGVVKTAAIYRCDRIRPSR